MIFQYDKGKPAPQLIAKLESGTNLNSIEWAPQGGCLTVFGVNSPNSVVYFVDANASGGTEANRIRTIEHPNLNRVKRFIYSSIYSLGLLGSNRPLLCDLHF